jgi:diacylglycerol kinase (ATP)
VHVRLRESPREAHHPGELSSARDALVIVNANASGSRRAEALVAAVEAVAEDSGVDAAVAITASMAELEQELRRGGERRIVLVGGDGSLHAAANLSDSALQLALLPAGRANNIASAMGIPMDPRAAAWLALHGSPRRLDVLHVEVGERALRVVEGLSAGFQAMARASYDGVNSGDLRAGTRSLMHAVRAYHPWHAEVEVDGRLAFSGDAAQIFVSNLPLFGFGFKVDPPADPGDGRLEVITAQADTRRELVNLLGHAYRGTHIGRPGVALQSGQRAVVRGCLPLAGDAEPLGLGDAVVSVEPGAIGLVAPPW